MDGLATAGSGACGVAALVRTLPSPVPTRPGGLAVGSAASESLAWKWRDSQWPAQTIVHYSLWPGLLPPGPRPRRKHRRDVCERRGRREVLTDAPGEEGVPTLGVWSTVITEPELRCARRCLDSPPVRGSGCAVREAGQEGWSSAQGHTRPQGPGPRSAASHSHVPEALPLLSLLGSSCVCVTVCTACVTACVTVRV